MRVKHLTYFFIISLLTSCNGEQPKEVKGELLNVARTCEGTQAAFARTKYARTCAEEKLSFKHCIEWLNPSLGDDPDAYFFAQNCLEF